MINKNDIKQIRQCKNGIEIILKDGRSGLESFLNYPRLLNADLAQRENYIMSYYGLHWPDLDEDLSFEGFFFKPDNFGQISEDV